MTGDSRESGSGRGEGPRRAVLSLADLRTIWRGDPGLLARLSAYWGGHVEADRAEGSSAAASTWSVTLVPARDEVRRTSTDPQQRRIVHEHVGDLRWLDAITFSAEVMTKLTLSQGCIWLHCSAFAIDGAAVLVMGPKGAGKTSWLLRALAEVGAGFIGNDQVPADFGQGVLTVSRWRPDIKMDASLFHHLGRPAPGGAERTRLVWLTTPGAAQAFAAAAAVPGGGARVTALPDAPPRVAVPGRIPVGTVVFLDPEGPDRPARATAKAAEAFMGQVLADPFTFLPHHLSDWAERRSFWSNVTGITADRETCERTLGRLQQIPEMAPVYRVSARAPFGHITEFLASLAGRRTAGPPPTPEC